MPCPFLREGRARYCHAAPVRKLILDGPGATEGGRCASAQYVECELAAKKQDASAIAVRIWKKSACSIAEFHRLRNWCRSAIRNFQVAPATHIVIAIPTCIWHTRTSTPPPNLLYSQNHFWLDAEESGLCHIGVDGFFADIAGTVDGVTFVSSRGTHCPALALTVHGVEWPMSFPNPLMIQKVNSRVRSDPTRLTADPLWRRLAV